jgi:hypothetical protein
MPGSTSSIQRCANPRIAFNHLPGLCGSGPCHSPARVGCFRLRPRALPPWPSVLLASPPDSRAGSQALAPRPSVAGGRGAKRAAACPQARCRLLMSAPCPHGTETRSGVGRVARRARLAAKPFSRALPRLTLKAGHKAGLPTTPITACGATRAPPRVLSHS